MSVNLSFTQAQKNIYTFNNYKPGISPLAKIALPKVLAVTKNQRIIHVIAFDNLLSRIYQKICFIFQGISTDQAKVKALYEKSTKVTTENSITCWTANKVGLLPTFNKALIRGVSDETLVFATCLFGISLVPPMLIGAIRG